METFTLLAKLAKQILKVKRFGTRGNIDSIQFQRLRFKETIKLATIRVKRNLCAYPGRRFTNAESNPG